MIPHSTTETFNNPRGSPDIQCRGNRTQKVQPAGAGVEAEQWDYTFNIFNKLTKVEITKLGVKTEFGFKYGADGYRVEKFYGDEQSPTDTRKFIMDGVHVILEKNANGDTLARYIPGIAMITRDDDDNEVIRYYLPDALGGHFAMMDEGLNITAVYQNDAWGKELLATEDVPNPYRWNGANGYYWDADAQLYLLGMRWYDQAAGRFVNRDPIGLQGGSPNLIAYAGNNPTNLIDPRGLFTPVQIVCCLAWAGFGAWSLVERVKDGACYGKTGKEFIFCVVGNLILALLPTGKDVETITAFLKCSGEALLKKTWSERKDALIDCITGPTKSGVIDAVKLAAAICCYPGILQWIRSRIPAPVPARAFAFATS